VGTADALSCQFSKVGGITASPIAQHALLVNSIRFPDNERIASMVHNRAMLEDHSLTIQFYACRLDDQSLIELIHCARDQMAPELPTFSDWLLNFVQTEANRRAVWRSGTLWEPTLPTITTNWTGEELGLAMEWCYCLATCPRSRALRTFANELLKFFITLSSHRLAGVEGRKRRSNKLQSKDTQK